MEQIITLFLIGCIGGFLSGLLGIGGGVVLIPLLVSWGQIPIKTAAAMSMAFIIFASISGILVHARLGNINYQLGLWLGASSCLGALAGGLISVITSEFVLQLIFLVIVLGSAIMLLFPKTIEMEPQSQPSKPVVVILGILKGFLTGMLGIGGGFVIMPLMINFMGVNTLTAIGTSLLVTFISAIVGLFSKMIIPELMVWSTVWIVLGAIFTAQIGGRVASKLNPLLLRLILFALLLGIFTEMIWKMILI